MACTARSVDLHRQFAACRVPEKKTEPHKPGLLSRLFDAALLSRQRQAQQEVGAYIASAGRLTDSVEREISERLINGGWNARR